MRRDRPRPAVIVWSTLRWLSTDRPPSSHSPSGACGDIGRESGFAGLPPFRAVQRGGQFAFVALIEKSTTAMPLSGSLRDSIVWTS